MNDDLKVLILALHVDELLEVAVNFEHGLNDFQGWQYYKEPDIKQKYMKTIQENTGIVVTDILKLTQIDHVLTVY